MLSRCSVYVTGVYTYTDFQNKRTWGHSQSTYVKVTLSHGLKWFYEFFVS